LSSTNGNKDFQYINRLAIQVYNGNTVLYAATASSDNSNGGLLISQDGGSTWLIWKGNNSGINNFASDIKITAPDPANNNQSVAIAAFGGGNSFTDTESDGLWFSVNGGVTWNRYYTAHPNEGRIDIATAPSNPYIVYIICESKDPNLPPSMHGTALVGNTYTWVPITPPLQGVIDGTCNPTSADITRGQDFYDLAIAVVPDNPYRLIVGGVDLWLYERNPFIFSDSWLQISNWAGLNCTQNGGPNLPKVHADQHFVLFENNNEAYVANDGGVWKSNNANSNFPTFSFRGTSLNITQFYCADAHPNAGSNIYIAGAQDNGTQHYQSTGLNVTNEVTGGDGMFCHIDQLNGTTQIASFTHQNFFVTQDNWQTVAQGSNGNKGRFANPTDYDDVNKKLYACDATGTFFRWNDPATSGTSTSTVSVSGFPTNLSDNLIWSIRVSPNVSGRAYFGFDGGIVVRTDNTHNASSIAGKRIFDLGLGTGHVVSCIEIERGNENHMLVTLSNYGITSVYETHNATAATPTWTAVEGNLPDMPVRWAMFNPNNTDQAFLATELGVWSTTNLNGSSTDWDPTNLGLSNTRIDMIKYRVSDLEMVVATFGRGLFTSDALSGSCEQTHNLNGITVSGSYRASQSISVQNSSVLSSASFNAPSVTMSNQFTVNNGATLMVDSDGCN